VAASHAAVSAKLVQEKQYG
jgi:hypothetical protein